MASILRRTLTSLLPTVVLSVLMTGQLFFVGPSLQRTSAAPPSSEQAEKENRWEKTIQAFEKSDRENPPKEGGVVFLGSSSIRGWDLKKWFPNMNAVNRGFGGSEISDAVFFFDRIVTPLEPRAIVFFAGGNDLARGESPETVAEDFKQLVDLLHDRLPETKMVVIAIKPSPKRWELIDEIRRTNQANEALVKEDPQIVFVDIDPPMCAASGMPRRELFVDDMLHLNDQGYALWTEMVLPHLEQSEEAKP